jgi:hypothetical protein
MSTKIEALTWLKSQSSNGHWTVACTCKKCFGKAFVKITVEDMANRMGESGLDFTKSTSLRKLSHSIVNG